jgi:hypothetical protein
MKITHGSLFTGRGGFDFAAHDLGIETIWNCEIDPWLRGKLRKFFPHTKQYGNVKYVKYAERPNIISAYKIHYSNRESLFNYVARGHHRRLLYDCQMVGLTRTSILEIYREIMSFRTSEERFTPMETQLCLL